MLLFVNREGARRESCFLGVNWAPPRGARTAPNITRDEIVEGES